MCHSVVPAFAYGTSIRFPGPNGLLGSFSRRLWCGFDRDQRFADGYNL